MLYGYRETIDEKVASVIPAADSIAEYDQWIDLLGKQDPHPNFVTQGKSCLSDHLFKEEYKGFKRPVLTVLHSDDVQRNAFFKEWDIVNVKSQSARDRQLDMIWRDENSETKDGDKDDKNISNSTLEEIHNLTEHDPWDRRTPEQKEEDEKHKRHLKDLQEKGEISGESFGDAQQQRDARAAEKKNTSGTVSVTDIRTRQNADGSFSVENVVARKWGNEIDDALKEQRETDAKVKKRQNFTPEDFAAVLRGDGSADHLDVQADPGSNKSRREPDPNIKPILSPAAVAARKAYKEDQELQAQKMAAEHRKSEDENAKIEHDQGIFRGCDLDGDLTITLAELPESFRNVITAHCKKDVLPLKDYPYNSQIGELALLPIGQFVNVVAMDNLKIEGMVSMITPSVMVASLQDKDQSGLVLYGHLKNDSKGSKTKKAEPDFYVVRIRSVNKSNG